MSTKKGLLGTLGLFVFGLALVFGLSLAEPEDACASGCWPFWSTANEWGMGATCAAAKSNCEARAINAADDFCAGINKDLCDIGTITFNSCYQSGGQTKVDCTLQFKCEDGPLVPFP